MPTINPEAIKLESEAIILKAGGQICDWLPVLDREAEPRDLDTVVRRALILNAMLQIYFKAPIEVILQWITKNGLVGDLAESEREVLAKNNDDLSEQELINLYWSIESLWTLLWVGSVIEDLPFNEGVRNELALLCPNLQRNEDGSKFAQKMRLRPKHELFRMLDLHYRLHWWTRNAKLTGEQTGDVRIDIIMERRKALEWVMDPKCDWDSVEQGT